MRKILPIILAATVYLTPLYPVYAQTTLSTRPTAATSSARPLPPGLKKIEDRLAKKEEDLLMRREKNASRSAELKAKLAKFKDKAKATRVEKINTNLNDINKRRVNQMTETLARISKFLDTLRSKVAEAENNGKDVTAVKSEIANAEAAWSAADASLKAQLENDYTIEVNTEKTVKEDAMTARNNLHTDLQAVHQKVVDSRKAVVDVVQSLISLVRSEVGTKDGE